MISSNLPNYYTLVISLNTLLDFAETYHMLKMHISQIFFSQLTTQSIHKNLSITYVSNPY